MTGIALAVLMFASVIGAGVGSKPALKIALTFDDGTKDHLAVAAPLLTKHWWQGTFNIVTDWVGCPNKMSWDDVDYEDFEGHKLDRKMLDLLRRYAAGGEGM